MKIKNTILLLMLCSLPFCAFADTPIDTLALKIHYATEYIETTNQVGFPAIDRQVLEIGNHSSKYYSELTAIYQNTIDSMRKAKVDIEIFVDYVQNTDKGQTYQIYKNYPQDGQLTWNGSFYEKIFFGYEENLPTIEWEFLEGDTTIIGYPCKKAKGTLRGTDWTVWYAIDLPYSDGPWKLCGLPGVILKATESRGCFNFTAIGIETAKEIVPIIHEKRKYQKTTPLLYQKELYIFWDNQKGYINQHILGDFNSKRDKIRLVPYLIEKYE
ncbi:GLPGLI family protein [Prevotella dentasini]